MFTLVATLLAHSWWLKTGIDRVRDFNVFWEHIAIIGGLALVAVLPRPAAGERAEERLAVSGRESMRSG